MLASEFRDRLDGPRLQRLLQSFGQVRVLVVGDLTLDEFATGRVERVSREAPVLILRHETTRRVPGGGANATYNLARLGAQVQSVGLIGDDEQGQALCELFAAVGIDTSGIVTVPGRPTVTKTRISGHARQSVTQQIVRIDRKSDEPPAAAIQQQLVQQVGDRLATVDVVVCSDYNEGVFWAESAIAAALAAPLTVVDAQRDLGRYRGATLFTPNLPEAELATGIAIRDEASLSAAAQGLLRQTQAQHLLITRGEDGMSLFAADGTAQHIPAFNRTQVFDVTGAGDTVVAALGLAIAAGGTPWEGAVLGNLAASLVVRQFGTTTTTVPEMEAALLALLEAEKT
ncbi:MAG: D-glycero-beta-D-manno-heptose-7-phosphate kinase [Oscillatoriales cyanobacterium SM2_1_8]|nr:D-glycero-beta-D-manno-heptose-7-phosphate kinase [Oscillatoriales cyanobacterium SM2_1_8]